MLKVHCEACGSGYEVDPRRVPPNGMKMRCPSCGASVHVAPAPSAASSLDDPLDLPAPKAAGPSAPRGAAGGSSGLGTRNPGLLDISDLPAPKPAPAGRLSGTADDDLSDLPARKPAPGAMSQRATIPGKLPAVTAPPPAAEAQRDRDLELDLPAPKPKGKPAITVPAPPQPSSTAVTKPSLPSVDIDLPAPKIIPGSPVSKPGGPLGALGRPSTPNRELGLAPRPGDKPSLPDLDLPAPKAAAPKPGVAKPPAPKPPALDLPPMPPSAKPLALDLDLPGAAKGAPKPLDLDLPAAKGAPKPLDLDLPAAKGAPKPLSLDLDLPATKAGGAQPPLDLDLPAAKGGAARPSLDLDLPAPKTPAKPGEPAKQGGLDLDLPAPAAPRFELDAPLQRPAPPPKRSFAKPQEEQQASPLLIPLPADLGASGGSLPKDSLAIDPKPFAAPASQGMLGTLDDLEAQPPAPPAQDLIDLPAPQDLPTLKKEKPKATTLGLGGKLGRDSLDLPPRFGGAAAALPASEPTPLGGPLRPAAPPAALSDLDLPAPRDLPVAKKPAPAATALGLGRGLGLPAQAPPPQSQGGFEVQVLGGAGAQRAGAELALDLPPLSRDQPRAPELDLGEFEGALDKMESKGGGSFGALEVDLGVPPARPSGARGAPGDLDFGDLAPMELPHAPSNTNAGLNLGLESPGGSNPLLPLGGDGLGFGDRLGAAARRADLGSLGLGDGSDLALPDATPGGSAFGELDLGVGRGSSSGGGPLTLADGVPRRAPDARMSSPMIEDAELLGDDVASQPDRRARRTSDKRGLPGWAIPLLVVGAVGAVGVGLGQFTHHGYFGVYLIEQLLPAAGDPAYVRTAIEHAEQQARGDTYGDLRKALTTLSDARNEAGLNRQLLTRSLLHENLYQLRYGDDPQSAQRAAAILQRVIERGEQSPELSLARAADAARRGELPEAKRLLAESAGTPDPFRELVAGEIALLDKQPAEAQRAFTAARKGGLGPRASWGLARALIAGGKLKEAEAAAQATLADSPRHPAAHLFLAEQALAARNYDAALGHVHAAAGRAAVDGVLARPSRSERAGAFALEGRVEEQRDHMREAQAAYEHALAADPQNVSVLLGSGRALMRLGRPQDALSRFDSALGAKPSTTADAEGHVPMLEAGLGAVQALLALSRPQEALTRSTALFAQYSAAPEVKLWHGQALAALERYDDAERNFRESIEAAPKEFAGYVALSQLLFKRDRPEEAARVLARASSVVEDSAEVRRMLGYSELARNHLAEAMQQFEAALNLDARDPGALFGMAVAQRKNGALDQAAATLGRLERVDPAFTGVALERGQLLEARGDYAGAIATYRKALAQRPGDSDLKLRLGATLVTAGQVDEAEAVLNQVLKERPTSAEAEHYLGRVLFARGETALAAQRFERAVNFDMPKAEYHMYLGWALLDQGNYGGALAAIERAIERDPNSGDARWLLGRVQLRTGAVKDALLNLQAALRLKPGRVEALASMGDAYDELRELPQAIKAYEEAVKRAPDHADWWYRLGRLQLDKGARKDAQRALSEAVLRGDKQRDRPTWLADAHRAYGDVLRESGRGAEAIDHYRLFLELAPRGHPERSEIEALVFKTRR